MWHEFWYWLSGQAAADRRRADQQALMAAITAMAETSRATTTLLQAFLDQFRVTEPPRLRQFDEEEDARKFIETKRGPLDGLSKLEAFREVLANMERD